MGKSSRSEPSDFESLTKKFKKLEEELLRARRKERDRASRRRLSSSSPSSSSRSRSPSSSRSAASSPGSGRSAAARPRPQPYQERRLCIEGVPTIEYIPEPSTSAAPHVPPPSPVLQRVSGPPPAAVSPPPPPPPSPPPGLAAAAATHSPPPPAVPALPDSQVTPQLNDEIMQLLGEDPSQKRVYGNDIQPDLAVRVMHVATSRLPKETRKELLDRYLVPANCTLIDTPLLNPEVKVAISEAVHKRDKGIEQKQKQIASAITCIAEALTLLISSEQSTPSTELIKLLMDAQKILCDCQNSDSLVRRNFILFNMKKELKDQLQATKIDKFLFSTELTETLKAAKAITKTADDMKPAPPKQTSKKVNPKTQKNHLNWRAPPQSHRSKGTQRSKEPAPKSRHENSSRPSSRPAASRSRR